MIHINKEKEKTKTAKIINLNEKVQATPGQIDFVSEFYLRSMRELDDLIRHALESKEGK